MDRGWQTSNEAAGNAKIDIRTLTNINRVGKRGLPPFYAPNGIELPKRLKVNESTIIRHSAPFNEGSFTVFPSVNSMVCVGTWDERLFDQCRQRGYVRLDGVMLPTGTDSIPDFGEADEEIMVHWRQIQILYAAKVDAARQRASQLSQSSQIDSVPNMSTSSSSSSSISMMDISVENLERKSDLQEMYDFWEGIKTINVDTEFFRKATSSMDKKAKKIYKSRFEERSKEYLMCRSGLYVSTTEKTFPCLKTLWIPFKSPHTSILSVREIAVKYALLTSGKTPSQIKELSHPFLCTV
jgi:hypothetical protein